MPAGSVDASVNDSELSRAQDLVGEDLIEHADVLLATAAGPASRGTAPSGTAAPLLGWLLGLEKKNIFSFSFILFHVSSANAILTIVY